MRLRRAEDALTDKRVLQRARPVVAKKPLFMQFPSHISILSRFDAGEMHVLFLRDALSGAVGLTIFPSPLEAKLEQSRDKAPSGGRAWSVESLVQLKVAGQAYAPFFAGGQTMRNSASVGSLRFDSQNVERHGQHTTVVTTLVSDFGFRCVHHLSWRGGEGFLESKTAFHNTSERPLSLEMLSSFSLGGVSPFAPDDASGRLILHRLQSAWCAEGRLQSEPLEALQLEAFYPGAVATGLRFGQVGSLPVRGHFPFVAVEDTRAGATWGATLAIPGSWQLEVGRRDDKISLSGGLTDREFGHWLKTVAPGESFESPTAVLAAVEGDVNELCARLVSFQEREPARPAPLEADLPIVFNEWCSSWGNPTHDNLLALADQLSGSDVRFLVLDAGWYVGHGDWLENPEKFPHGLAQTARAIRERGLVPGMWFELENCESNSHAWNQHSAHLLQRDGVPLETQTRRFFDFRQQWTHDYLAGRVIELLRRCDIGYLKVDYNDTIGLGADGSESLGESLRAHLEGVQRFWRRIREELPDLIIENCASGGHRLEPSMMALCDQASFSDAHELRTIPIIAANLQRAILPRKSQIWAVLRQGDDERRLAYSLAATLLGRMCLSGDAEKLSAKQWQTVVRGQKFYRLVWPVIARGQSRRFGPAVASYNHPTGWQGVLRFDSKRALVVCHRFDATAPQPIEIELPRESRWRIEAVFGETQSEQPPRVADGTLHCFLPDSWSACAVWLEAEEEQ